jgi:GT2 family glycosyltransferase
MADVQSAPAETVAIAVAISTLGRPRALQRCLESLASGAALPSEVVVVDQSTDGETRRVVDGLGALPKLRYLAQSGTGLGTAQNAAVANTTAPVVAILDDDCVADEDWVALVAELLAPDSDLDLVGGRVLALGDDAPGMLGVSLRASEEARDLRGRSLPWELGSGNNFAVRRERFDRVGGCDERLGPGSPGLGGVDMDLFYRLLRDGARGRYEPRLVVYHERTNAAGRLARRAPYGHGMAAACVLWLREGDRYALLVLAAWLRMRARALISALRGRRWRGVREELLVLSGTARGLLYGLRVGAPTGRTN